MVVPSFANSSAFSWYDEHYDTKIIADGLRKMSGSRID